MVWNERRAYRTRILAEKESQRREAAVAQALKSLPESTSKSTFATPAPTFNSTPLSTPSKPLPYLERLHQENQKRREEREKEEIEIEKRKEEKLRQRVEWKRKFQKRTRKGQVPLDHRVNYIYKKIKKSPSNL
ncbi:hypothetical protein NEHOM01_2254 [Nematocida homosporus]|uniref:uncharacterized protein n=1 Tax=Nematocida homosporus TaxID=1912981 RepID=UPI00221EF49A|nr:uncharacterized protein NEHOM01_2254 [Nematocida homosporus]KAI5187539.1 hypothetical protein NEHOM01_2254 [Nematocida homosporus]